MQKILILPFLCIILFSCEKEEPTPVTYFEITIDDQFSTDESDDWIVLHDNNDRLLAARHFEAGERIVFDSTVIIDKEFNVTLFQHSNSSGEYFYVQSFLGVAPAQVWTVSTNSSQAPDRGDELGKFVVSIADPNLGPTDNAMVSDKYSNFGSTSAMAGSVSFSPTLHTDANDLFVFATDNNGTPKYLFLENLTPGSKAISLQDLQDFEHTVDVTFPGPSEFSNAFVRGYENGEPRVPYTGYFTNFYIDGLFGGIYSGYKLGFTNHFTTYSVSIFASVGSYNLMYESLGPAPAGNIELTKANVQIPDKTFSGFTVSGTDFNWRSSVFRSGASTPRTDWIVNSDKEHVGNHQLPQAFASKYPAFNNGNLTHSGTTFYIGSSYADFLAEKFTGAAKKFSVVRSTMIW